MQRSLAGSWQFQLDPEGTVRVDDLTPDRQIHVPMPWQAVFPELESYSGYAWYRTELDLDAVWLEGDLLLTFGAVDYWCEVYVNGRLVGQHEGGYTPFTFRIKPFVQIGSNHIAVRVYDSAQAGFKPTRWLDQQKPVGNPPFDPVEIPHGKQEWYLNVGGLWQEVTLTSVPTVYIDKVRVTPIIQTGQAVITVDLAGNLAQVADTLRAQIGEQTAEIAVKPHQTHYTMSVTVPDVRLWTPETPELYTAVITLTGAAGEDAQYVRFGFREIAIRDGQLLLNGEPIYLRAALDQDMYPETIYSVPSEVFLRDEFAKAKELGLNCLRCHIKPPDPLYLDLADEMGLLVWAEIPSWRTFALKFTMHHDAFNVNADIKARVKQTLTEMIRRDYNHPSLIIWTIVNEDWGTALALSPGDRAWITEMVETCKRLDATRLVVDNSACMNGWGPNIHVKSDLDDFHVYTNIPDQAPYFTSFVEQFSMRPTWTYSNHGDAQRTGHEPLILSEFGNWGLPSISGLRDAEGNLPDWFKLGPWWSGWDGEPGWPKGALERFERFGLKRIWGDYEGFAAASQWHQFQAMKFEIETMRRLSAIKGYVITELSDIYWESNGLLDFNRREKAYHQAFGTINAADVIVPQLARYATWDDQALPVRLYASHYSKADWNGAQLTFTVGGQRTDHRLDATKRGAINEIGLMHWQFAAVDKASMKRVELWLNDGQGNALAQNDIDVMVLPAATRKAAHQGQIAVRSAGSPFAAESNGESALGSAIQGLGYTLASALSAETLLVTDAPDAETIRWVREGGSMLYLCSGVSPFFWVQGRGGIYGGSWITSFSWLRPDIFKRLAVTNPLTMPFGAVAPRGVISNLPVDDATFHDDFLAGQISGWVQLPAIHTVQFKLGRGKVLMTTATLASTIGGSDADPVAVAMFHDLVDHLASPACQPKLTTNL
ncbi:MAG: hypothetical protein KF716_17550 [Anaerolineae bacterium]|nr:hypothetical protein [Anaerolineae bacterium]